MRERGLKSRETIRHWRPPPSLPMRERGLKYQVEVDLIGDGCRSPCGSVD